jgi:hypothetical protein
MAGFGINDFENFETTSRVLDNFWIIFLCATVRELLVED